MRTLRRVVRPALRALARLAPPPPCAGRFTCCERNHMVNGLTIPCDKRRLKPVMLKMYGALLMGGDTLPLSEALLEDAERIWPAEVFDHGETHVMRAFCLGEEQLDGPADGARDDDLSPHSTSPLRSLFRGPSRLSSPSWRSSFALRSPSWSSKARAPHGLPQQQVVSAADRRSSRDEA